MVFTSREHIIALEARGKGLMGCTLRYPYEVRNEKDYFDDIENEKVPKDMLELASHIVDTKRGKFDPSKFEDPLRRRAQGTAEEEAEGREDRALKEATPSNVVDLMEALRQSVSAEKKAGGARVANRLRRERITVRPRKRAAAPVGIVKHHRIRNAT